MRQRNRDRIPARRQDLPAAVAKVLGDRERYAENFERLLNRFERTYEEKAKTLLAKFCSRR